jgi:hypothetical protein
MGTNSVFADDREQRDLVDQSRMTRQLSEKNTLRGRLQ